MSQLTSIGPELPLPKSQAYRDWLGVGASVLCAIHCCAMPFVVGFLPLLGLSFLADPSFHQWMVAICLALALLAFVPGWRRHHRLAPAAIGIVGLGLITFAAFAGPDDCCPTPCEGGSDGTNATAMTVAMATPAPCTATCCDAKTSTNDGPTTEPTTGPSAIAGGPEATNTDDACAASCCSNGSSSKASSGSPASSVASSSDDPSCTATCCPEDSGVATAGTSDLMALVWLWMTPIGGLVLVVAHLTNHRLSAHCKRACCAVPTGSPTTT